MVSQKANEWITLQSIKLSPVWPKKKQQVTMNTHSQFNRYGALSDCQWSAFHNHSYSWKGAEHQWYLQNSSPKATRECTLFCDLAATRCVPCCQPTCNQYLTILFVSCKPFWSRFLWPRARKPWFEMSCVFCRASFLTKTVPCGQELHKFLIWDTAGQERVRARAHMHTHTHLICSLLSLTHDLVDHISHFFKKRSVKFRIKRRTMTQLSHCESLSWH